MKPHVRSGWTLPVIMRSALVGKLLLALLLLWLRNAFISAEPFASALPTASSMLQTSTLHQHIIDSLPDLKGDFKLASQLPATTTRSGAGHFTDSGQRLATGWSTAIALGDLDGDGDLDLFTASFDGPNTVWFNDGVGHLTDSGQRLGNGPSTAVALADVDGDQDLDALVTQQRAPNELWLNQGDGNFSNSGQTLGIENSTAGAFGDLDGDQDVDIFLTNQNQPNRVWLNDGAGRYTNSGQQLGDTGSRAVALGDVDGDGDLDALIANGAGRQPDHLWLNNGSGQFTDSGQQLGNAISTDVQLGDLDNDQDLDAFVAVNGANLVWLNNGAGHFTSSPQPFDTATSSDVALGDVDQDGDLDAVVANRITAKQVWLNDGAGHFTDSGQQLAAFTVSHAVVLGDMDGDGDLDALFGQEGAPDQLFQNGRVPTDAARFPVLALDKTVAPSVVAPGATVTYTVLITATDQASAFHFTATIPAGLSYRTGSSTGGAHYDPLQRQLTYTGTLGAGASHRITYQATVAPSLAPGTLLASTAVVATTHVQRQRTATVVIPDPSPTPTLLLIYAVGDNNLSADMYRLLNNAEQGAATPQVVTLLMLDGPTADDAAIYRVQVDNEPFCPSFTNPLCNGRYVLNQNYWRIGDDTADADSLANFLQSALAAYPQSERLVVSLVGHGSGWAPNVPQPAYEGIYQAQPGFMGEKAAALSGMLWDEHPRRSLATAELGHSLTVATTASGRRIDLLYLDACSMAMSEVAYEVRTTADYLLASANQAWTAFPYAAHIKALATAQTTKALGQAWLMNEQQLLHEAQADHPTQPFFHPYTLALIDLQQMATVRQSQDALATALMTAMSTAETAAEARNRIRRAFDAADCFDSNYDGAIDEQDVYCDLRSFAQALAQEFADQPAVQSAAQQLQESIGQAVVNQSDALATNTQPTIRKPTITAPTGAVITAVYRNGEPWVYPGQRWQWQTMSGLSIYTPLNLAHDEWKRQHYATALRASLDGGWDNWLDLYWSASKAPATAPLCPPACTGIGAPIAPMPAQARATLFLPLTFR